MNFYKIQMHQVKDGAACILFLTIIVFLPRLIKLSKKTLVLLFLIAFVIDILFTFSNVGCLTVNDIVPKHTPTLLS